MTTTTDPAATDEAGGAPDRVALLDDLDPPLPAVLRAALEELVSLGVAEQFAGADDDAAKLRSLVDLVSGTAVLRTLLRATGPHLEGSAEQLAADLVDVADDKSSAAAKRVKDQVTAAVAQQKRKRRQESRAAKSAEKAPLEERAQTRRDREVEKLRAARDRAQGRAAHLEDENAALREQLRSSVESAEEAMEREASLRSQLHRLRTRAEDVSWLSGLLAEALDAALLRAAHPAEDRGADAFAAVDETSLLTTLTSTLTSPAAEGESGAGEGPARRTLRQMLRALATPPPATTTDLGLRVDVLGGGAEIGGSCVLVEAAGTRILVDCGARPQGTTVETTQPRRFAEALAGSIHAVIVTHAHHDHAGWVPALVAQRPGIPVYATPATCDLLVPMWHDSAKVMSRNGLAAFGRAEVEAAIDAFRETPFNTLTKVGNVTIELGRAGHIVGAASVVVQAGDQRVLVSGDVSASGQETVGGFVASRTALGADLMLLESTYAGDKHHEPRGQVIREFLRAVESTVERGGVALVPAFALGRAQEVALVCAKYLPEVPVLIDGLARDITDVYEQHAGPGGGGRKIFSDRVQRVPVRGTDRAIQDLRAGVVIATSGMLNQGPAVSWAHRVLPDPRSSLMVVGYQDAETPGAKLLRLADAGGGTFTLPGQRGAEPTAVQVRANVGRYQLGAHASADELSHIVASTQPQRLMLVHGEPAGQAQFAARMRARAQSVVSTGEWSGRT